MSRLLRSLAVLAVLAVAAYTATARDDSSSGGPESDGKVVRVVDGDTIVVDIGGAEETVRLIGIDTPEIAHPAFGDRPPNDAECFGDEAQRYTGELLAVGSGVRLERDVVARDDYGRLLM